MGSKVTTFHCTTGLAALGFERASGTTSTSDKRLACPTTGGGPAALVAMTARARSTFCVLAIVTVLLLAIAVPHHVRHERRLESSDVSSDINGGLVGLRKRITPLDQAEQKGRQLYELMRKPQSAHENISPTIWKTSQQLFAHKWAVLNPRTRLGERTYETSAVGLIGDAVEALAAASPFHGPKTITEYPWSQGSGSYRHKDLSTYELDGKTYQKTGAEYENRYSPTVGLIVVEGAYSPAFRAKANGVPKDMIGPAPHWSDVASITWTQLCQRQGIPLASLRSIIHTHVDAVNEGDTGSLLREMHPGSGGKPFRWPEKFADGKVFKPGEKDFDVVLGSPSGRGTAYLFLQHRTELGEERYVEYIKIWQPAKDSAPCIFFAVSEAESK